MEFLIIGSGCVIGYLLNKNERQPRKEKQTYVSPNNKPTGPLIYESHRVKEVDEYVRDLAAQKHVDKVKQMYPQDYKNPINIFPDDPAGENGSPANLISLGDMKATNNAQNNFSLNMKNSLALNSNTAAFDPQSAVAVQQTTNTNIDTSPMFRANSFKAQTKTDMSERAGPISLLTGLPLDMNHANMQPFFGSAVKQSG